MSEERLYNAPRRVSHAEFETMCRADSEELSRVIVGLALADADGSFVERACLRLSTHDDEFVRGNAILGFGHLARRFGALSPVCKPVIERGIVDKSEHVRSQSWAAASDTHFFLGWSIEGYEPGPGLEDPPDDCRLARP